MSIKTTKSTAKTTTTSTKEPTMKTTDQSPIVTRLAAVPAAERAEILKGLSATEIVAVTTEGAGEPKPRPPRRGLVRRILEALAASGQVDMTEQPAATEQPATEQPVVDTITAAVGITA